MAVSETRGSPTSTTVSTTGSVARRVGAIDWIALVLLIIGGLNWGLVGLFGVDLVARIFGDMSLLSRIVYVLVGLSALYTIYFSTKLSNRT